MFRKIGFSGKRVLLVGLVAALGLVSSASIAPAKQDTSSYPYVIPRISMEERQRIYQQLVEANQNCVFETEYRPEDIVDEYGRVIRIPCGKIIGEDVTAATFTEEYARNFATNFILKNRDFLGISSDELKIDRVWPKATYLGSEYIFDFKGQEYQGLKVRDTSLRAIVGHSTASNSISDLYLLFDWYKEINAPTIPKISEPEAKARIAPGRTLCYPCATGQQCVFVTVSAEPAEKLIFAFRSSRGLEIRLAWQIKLGTVLTWLIYVDAITGEELFIQQGFICD